MQITPSSLLEIEHWLREAGEFALAQQTSVQITMKRDHTPVTNAEFAIEKTLVNHLQEHFPGTQMLTEENGSIGDISQTVWVLDPIDGTKAYLNGLPSWCISLGLVDKGKPVAGWIYLPATRDLYYSVNQTAFLNKQPLPKALPLPLDDPLAFLAVPANAHRHYDIRYPRLRSFGSTAFHLAFLARGSAIGVLTRKINLWDMAGVLPILNTLGYQIEYLSGAAIDLQELIHGEKTPDSIIAAHPQNLASLREMILRKD